MKVDNTNFYLRSTLVKTSFDIDDEHIKAAERIIRDSLEYRKFIADKRQNENENFDPLLSQFDFKDCKKAKLELHHDVFLYDLVSTAYAYLVQKTKEYVSTFDVASLVLEWHYRNIVPYIFLSESAHGLFHDGKYSYDRKCVKGNYKQFYEEYLDYLSPSAKERLEQLLEA